MTKPLEFLIWRRWQDVLKPLPPPERTQYGKHFASLFVRIEQTKHDSDTFTVTVHLREVYPPHRTLHKTVN